MNKDELRARYADILEATDDDAGLGRLLSALDTSYRAAEPPASLTAHPAWRARTSTRYVSPSVSAHGWRRVFERAAPHFARPIDDASTEPAPSGSKQSRRRAVFELAAIVLVVALVVGGVALWQAPERLGETNQGATTSTPATPASLLLLTASPTGGNKLLIHSIDPTTLADIPGRQPLEIDNGLISAFSPNNRLLAFFGGSPSSSETGELQILDLASWTIEQTVTINQATPWLVFSKDSQQLYWLGAKADADSLSVMRYDIASRKLSSLNHLSADFLPEGIKVVDQGTALAVFGIRVDAQGSQGAPHLYLFDLATGRDRANLTLPTVKVGVYPSTAGNSNGTDSYSWTPGLAWDTQRNLLYIVHADAERITEIDLTRARVIRDAGIRKPTSLLDRLDRWLMPHAAALQIIPSTLRTATLSPDGSRLYVVNRKFGPTDNGKAALGMLGDAEIISANDFHEIGTISGHVESLAVSPDGRSIIVGLQNVEVHSSLTPNNYTLALYDAAGLHEIAHLDSSDRMHVAGFSADSRYAYVETGNAMKVFDLSARRFVASRAVTGGAPPGALLGPTIAPAYGGF